MKRTAAADDAVPIDGWLRDLGYETPSAKARARGVLVGAGLTNARKQNIAAYKLAGAERALASALIRVCSAECAKLARTGDRSGRDPITTASATCEVCGGSNNRRAALSCREVLRKHRVSSVLVVGGTATINNELQQIIDWGGVRFEFVDGTKTSHSQKDAIAHLNRAQLMIIWGSTPLRHAVSNLYTQDTPAHVRTITVSRRGIEALCAEIVSSYTRRAGGR
jgi:hypothetical protein